MGIVPAILKATRRFSGVRGCVACDTWELGAQPLESLQRESTSVERYDDPVAAPSADRIKGIARTTQPRPAMPNQRGAHSAVIFDVCSGNEGNGIHDA